MTLPATKGQETSTAAGGSRLPPKLFFSFLFLFSFLSTAAGGVTHGWVW